MSQTVKCPNCGEQNKCTFESHVLTRDEHNISPETITLLQKFIKKIL